jgi:hypothetical protein
MPPIELTASLIADRLKEGTVRGVVWGFVGILFGSLFLGIYQVALAWGGPLHPFVVAGTLATGFGALIYGSMRLAVIIAILCAPLSVVLLIQADDSAGLLALVLPTALSGALIGSLYGLFAQRSRIYRADAKTLTGLAAGALVALPGILLIQHFELPITIPWSVALLCPIAGLVYTQLVEHFLSRFENLLPPAADGALVGLAVAAYVGLGLWLIAGYVDPLILHQHAAIGNAILEQLPSAMIGGMCGGFLGGFMGGISGREWQDL